MSRSSATRTLPSPSHTLCRPRRWPAHPRPASCRSTSQRRCRGPTTRLNGSHLSAPKSILKTNPINTGVLSESQASASGRRDSTRSATPSTSKFTAPTSSQASRSTLGHRWCRGQMRTTPSDHSVCRGPTQRNRCRPTSATASRANAASNTSPTELSPTASRWRVGP